MKKLILIILFSPFLSLAQPVTGEYMPVSFDQWQVIRKDTTIFLFKGWKPLLLAPPSFDMTFEYIVIRKVYVPPAPISIDNIDSRNVYGLTWTHTANTSWLTNFHNKTGSFSSTTGATIITSFTGHTVEWWTEKRENHGIAGVSIDNGPEEIVDLYADRTDNNSQLVYSRSGLANGNHTIKIRVTGNKNLDTDGTGPDKGATEVTVIHDRLVAYK